MPLEMERVHQFVDKRGTQNLFDILSGNKSVVQLQTVVENRLLFKHRMPLPRNRTEANSCKNYVRKVN